MRSVFQYIETIAPSGEPALITGETGVGKELFAKAIHALSQCEGEFVAINAAGLDDHVFSDTLFGHKKGAFTGAESSRPGLVEQAQDGTLFLDEVGDLPQASQIKLLRLLQEREYFPLGSDVAKKAHTRIVTATNRDLNALTKTGEFRKDLFYRLGTHRVHIPPLRRRKEDLSELLDHFLVESAEALGKKAPTYPKELIALIATYPYPGNVRELKAMVYEAVTHHKGGVLSMSTFREHIRSFGTVPEDDLQAAVCDGGNVVFSETLPTLKEVNDALIAEALLRAENNQAIAAEMLGISRQALNKRLKQKP